ncbi:MAG: flagellar biosynthetic protein FliO [Clostridia bacterium]
MDNALSTILAILGLCFVLWLAYWTSRWIASRSAQFTQGKYLKMIDRIMVGNDKWITLVQLGDKIYMIGITGQRIEQIGETDISRLAPLMDGESGAKPGDFKTRLAALLENKPAADSSAFKQFKKILPLRRPSHKETGDTVSALLDRIHARQLSMEQRKGHEDGEGQE